MNAFGRRGGGGGMRAAARISPGGRRYQVRGREHPEGGWEIIEDEEGPLLGGAENLGAPGGTRGRAVPAGYTVVVLPDGFVVHQYPEGHLHIIRSPGNIVEDTWLYREGDTAAAWQELTAEVWEARRAKAEQKVDAAAAKAVVDVAKAVVKAVDPAPKAAEPPPVKAPPFPAAKPRVPALDAKPRRVPWGVLAFLAAIGAVVVLGGGKGARKRSGEAE